MSIPITRQHGSPGTNKRRAEIMDELRTLSIDFIREPTMARVDQMEKLRAEQTELERNIVTFVVNQKVFAMMLEDAKNQIVTDDEAVPMTDDEYGEAASGY